jgi:hypothetical protein
MEAQAIGTKRNDDVRQCIEAAIARRKEEFALACAIIVTETCSPTSTPSCRSTGAAAISTPPSKATASG